jgi:hypothetical protein
MWGPLYVAVIGKACRGAYTGGAIPRSLLRGASVADDSEKQAAIVPVEQRAIDFYGDELVAVRDEDGTVWVPVRRLCEALGVSRSGQIERIQRDPVLSDEVRTSRVTRPDGRVYEMECLPLKFVRAWLFGINATRVKTELRDKLIAYQREVIEVIDRHFSQAPAPTPSTALMQIRELGLAIAHMAEQQMELEARTTTLESRMQGSAVWGAGINRRLAAVEQRLTPGALIDEVQAAEISAAVKALAELLTRPGAGSAYQTVFAELYRRFGVSSYRNIKLDDFEAVLAFLDDWRGRAVGGPAARGDEAEEQQGGETTD